MADVYVNALTEQLTEPSTTDSMVMVNRSTNEGKIIDYNKLADVILAKLTSKQYDSLTTASKLLPGAINELDADAASMSNSISALNSRLDETFPSGKILRISSGNSTKVRISGITVGSASPIPCWIGEKAGALYISRNGSEVSAVKFVGTDKPTNALTLNKASDGTWYVDITATAWTPFMFIWFVNPNTDGNISISTV